MAEGFTPVSDDQQLSWNSWWQTAKEKSSVAFEFMKKDLTEFTQTVHQDAASAISATTSVVKQTLRLDDKDSVASQTKEGLQTLFGKISDAFYPTLEREDDELLVIRDSQPVTVEKWHAYLHYIQTHPSNYSHKPDGSIEDYQKWLESFKLEEHEQEISDVLDSPEVRTLYTGMVPGILSNLEFWQRFFYRIFQHDIMRTKRADLVRRAEQGEPLNEMAWDEDETSHKNIQTEREVPLQSKYNDTNEDTPKNKDHDDSQSKVSDESAELKIRTKSSLSLLDDTVIINSSPSSSGTDVSRKANTEDEWEKDFDLEETVVDEKVAETASVAVNEEDWENWE